jgi:hypothetical protein
VGRAATPQISPLPQAITKFPPQKTNFSINYEISGLKVGSPRRGDRFGKDDPRTAASRPYQVNFGSHDLS